MPRPSPPVKPPVKKQRRERTPLHAAPEIPAPVTPAQVSRAAILRDSREARWLLAGIVALAFGLRLYRLLAIPVAGAESVYLRWAEIILHQKQWFISLLDGKQPLSY